MSTDERLPNVQEDEIELWPYLEALWKRKVFVLSMTLSFTILALITSFLLPRSYRSEVVLKIGSIGNIGSIGSTGAVSTSIDDENNVAALVRSRPFLATVIHNKALKKGDKLLKPEEIMVKTSIEKNTHLINIQAEAESPDEAVMIVNAVAGEVIERHKAKYDQAMGIVNEMEKDLQVQIAASEAGIAAFKESLDKIHRNPGVNAPAIILLKANLNDNENRLSSLKQRLREVQLANSPLRSENTRIVDPAILPEIPVRPNKRLILFLGACSGFMIGILSAFVQESYVRRKKESNE